MPQFSSLSELFSYHFRRRSKPIIVDTDLAAFLERGQSATSLAKEIYSMGVHIGTWKQFNGAHKLRMALRYNPRYNPYPLSKAKNTRVVKQCLIECLSAER